MMLDIYDRIIIGIMWGFIALPLYFGYIEFAGHEPSWLVNMAISIISGVLVGLIWYWFFTPKKDALK
ncbi:MAG: hypothetical protein HYT15_05130 [Candidatus Magasanikbacteria bacterium]|nr:hypothetical protein [Candidatus Magasanikbacteria bacterium]